jgi:pantoate--beta-alanine ligase
MKIINSLKDWRKIRKTLCNNAIGFVATMGNLHEGHESLIARSLKDNDITVLTIFINPTQFNDKKDLENYPKTLEQDKSIAEKLRVDFLFLPQAEEIYPDDYKFMITPNTYCSKILEGEHRPNHFTGMLTIVLKLFLIIKPSRAYFGEKDYQQFKLIKDMSEAFLLDLEIICCPTIRNKYGLPFSSRNNLLTSDELSQASLFSKLLLSKLEPKEIKNQLEQKDFQIDYIEEYNNRRFGAVKFNNVRLLDNVPRNDESEV